MWGRSYRRPSETYFMELIIRGVVATGASSRALAMFVLGLGDDPRSEERPFGPIRPWDFSDWQRCVNTYNAMPRRLRKKAMSIMTEWGDELVLKGRISGYELDL